MTNTATLNTSREREREREREMLLAVIHKLELTTKVKSQTQDGRDRMAESNSRSDSTPPHKVDCWAAGGCCHTACILRWHCHDNTSGMTLPLQREGCISTLPASEILHALWITITIIKRIFSFYLFCVLIPFYNWKAVSLWVIHQHKPGVWRQSICLSFLAHYYLNMLDTPRSTSLAASQRKNNY